MWGVGGREETLGTGPRLGERWGPLSAASSALFLSEESIHPFLCLNLALLAFQPPGTTGKQELANLTKQKRPSRWDPGKTEKPDREATDSGFGTGMSLAGFETCETTKPLLFPAQHQIHLSSFQLS